MIGGILFIPELEKDPAALYEYLRTNANWDDRMTARRTASYGVAYNYSQISYPYAEMLPPLHHICEQLKNVVGFLPNNCLINYYLDGHSKMGYHADQTDILSDDTGIAIVSLGATRSLRFKNIADPAKQVEYSLPSGSLIYMTQEVQKEWLHAIPKSDTQEGRMSLTFRKMK